MLLKPSGTDKETPGLEPVRLQKPEDPNLTWVLNPELLPHTAR